MKLPPWFNDGDDDDDDDDEIKNKWIFIRNQQQIRSYMVLIENIPLIDSINITTMYA